LLRTVGFEVQEATNGQEALKQYERWQPHLIWMDMRMPIMDGYTATREIRRAEEKPTPNPSQEGNQSSIFNLQSTIIIALTASAFEEDRQHVLAAGCDDFVRKPLQEADIFDAMSKHLGVQYVYAERQESKVESRKLKVEEMLTPEALVTLPPELLANIEHAVLQGDVEVVNEVIGAIRPSHPAVADALASLADNFAYGEILRMVQEANKHQT